MSLVNQILSFCYIIINVVELRHRKYLVDFIKENIRHLFNRVNIAFASTINLLFVSKKYLKHKVLEDIALLDKSNHISSINTYVVCISKKHPKVSIYE